MAVVGGEGPRYIKIGGRVVYRLEDVEEYEREQIRASAADHPSKPAASGVAMTISNSISDALGTATELRAQRNYAGHRKARSLISRAAIT